ncbi:MAG TPA: hypothetical protein VHA73_08290 [Acidimicrobiales bacterium]|jgi:hypothetical protein|nr:hypothetical protein [Acidimicrobiales bacterium]
MALWWWIPTIVVVLAAGVGWWAARRFDRHESAVGEAVARVARRRQALDRVDQALRASARRLDDRQ